MDKTKIKKFAIDARRQLIDEITLKMNLLGITKDGIQEPTNATNDIQFFGDFSITGNDIQRRKKLIAELQSRSTGKTLAEALPVFIEEIAYTWFNRLIAIRFMEVNHYLPGRIRVLSSEIEGQDQPDIIKEALNSDLVFTEAETEQIKFALLDQTVDVMNDLYKMIFIKQANQLNTVLPKLFEKIADYSELLFTPNYTDVNGVIHKLVHDIDESDFDVKASGQVEIIGWLYQYYNTEPHTRAISITGGAVKKSDIPAATQLFTTDWVVRYMVDNSLGKYWLEHESDSKLANELAYLLPGEINPRSENLIIEDIKIMDNAMGSGHILVYAFDVLMKMYQERGYSSRDAAVAIIENNIVGLEIDKRAYQLAYFALFMKAREYNRRILSMGISPKLYVFQDILSIPNEFYEQLSTSVTDDLQNLVAVFKDATELGSIIQLDKTYNIPELREAVSQIKVIGLDIYGLTTAKGSIQNMLNIVDTLQSKYEIIVTNPPYMNKFEPNLKKYIGQHYASYKGDLFAVFIYNNLQLLKKDGYAAYMTPFVWMFIKTYEALRTYILDTKQISSLIQMEYSAFEEATVPINTFVIKNTINQELGSYVKLSEFTGGMSVQDQKVQDIIKNPDAGYLYRTNQSNFESIPGSPIAYWASADTFELINETKKFGDAFNTRAGMITGDNSKFIRLWHEVSHDKTGFNYTSRQAAEMSGYKWFPYSKGGDFRRWFGNNEYVVNWENDGKYMRNFKDSTGKIPAHAFNLDYIFHPQITWSSLSSKTFSARLAPNGFLFDASGSFGVVPEVERSFQLGFLNSVVAEYYLGLINPTLNFQKGNIASLPIKSNDIRVEPIVETQISLSKADWDSFETSWDFATHPLIQHIDEHNRNWTVEAAFKEWQDEAQARFDQLKANEEELNRIFIDLYGLQDELTPEVEDKDVSVRLADEERDIKSLLSYFIGLVFGRYSLDVDGLAYAGGEFDKSKYKSFMPNAENVVMLTDADYFGDERDIINRFKEFLTVTFGEENLAANMTYIANVLGGKGTPEEVVRNYFFKDFSKDHNQTYKKRPIYWQLESGKQGGFKALIYLHRYDADTMAMIRTNYLNELQAAYESRLSTLTNLIDNANDTKSKNAFEKQRAKLLNQLDELVAYEAKIAYLANKHVVLDLDDGVVENYKKVQLDEDNQSLGVFRKI